MATPVAQEWSNALQVERELVALLKQKTPHFEDVDRLILRLRISCEATIFLDFAFAWKEGVERHLWDAHTQINNRYRKMIEHHKQGEAQKKIELRKTKKRYGEFIKESQRFYKGYIQRLASHFGGMKNLRRIAHRLNLNPQSADERVNVSSDLEHLIDMSCHAALLQLGDLSRYKNSLRTKDRSWEATLGHYRLANDFMPDNGSAHNQMAVIALSEGNHLHAVYHLYRALVIAEPHPIAKANLELELKKIKLAREKHQSQSNQDSLTTLVSWFVLLHAKYYDGSDFKTREELEKEVLSRLTFLLKEGDDFGDVLAKFVLINIAAEAFAGQRVAELGGKSTPDGSLAINSFFFCFGFNVRMLSMLLQVLKPELEDTATGEDLPSEEKVQPLDPITNRMKRVLPSVRQYSIWLVAQLPLIVAPLDRGSTNVHIQEMWKMLADVLTQLVNLFSVNDIAPMVYLLEEDESTVGFKPFRDPNIPHECDIYSNDAVGVVKSRLSDPGVQKYTPDLEMLSRIRDIILCGLVLAGQVQRDNSPEAPLSLNDGVFLSLDKGMPAAHPTNPIQSPKPVSSLYSPAPAPASASRQRYPGNQTNNSATPPASMAPSDSHSLDANMNRFVDDLVGPSRNKPHPSNETSYGMHNLKANDLFQGSVSNGLHTRAQSIPKTLPTLPGISNAWAPQSGEFQQYGQKYLLRDKPTTYGQLNTSASLVASPWLNMQPQIASQEQDTHLSMPLTVDSEFSNNSSIYANTSLFNNHQLNGRERLRTAMGTPANGNSTTYYPGGTDFSTEMMLNSPLPRLGPVGSARRQANYSQTPPGGQGG